MLSTLLNSTLLNLCPRKIFQCQGMCAWAKTVSPLGRLPSYPNRTTRRTYGQFMRSLKNPTRNIRSSGLERTPRRGNPGLKAGCRNGSTDDLVVKWPVKMGFKEESVRRSCMDDSVFSFRDAEGADGFSSEKVQLGLDPYSSQDGNGSLKTSLSHQTAAIGTLRRQRK